MDAAGNAWLANSNGNSVTELAAHTGAVAAGTPLSPPITGFTGAGISMPAGISVDPSGNVWVVNFALTGSVTELIGVATPTKTPIVSAIKNGFIP
jgi:DNA-binding beta-propeller fold protein YncE